MHYIERVLVCGLLEVWVVFFFKKQHALCMAFFAVYQAFMCILWNAPLIHIVPFLHPNLQCFPIVSIPSCAYCVLGFKIII